MFWSKFSAQRPYVVDKINICSYKTQTTTTTAPHIPNEMKWLTLAFVQKWWKKFIEEKEEEKEEVVNKQKTQKTKINKKNEIRTQHSIDQLWKLSVQWQLLKLKWVSFY